MSGTRSSGAWACSRRGSRRSATVMGMRTIRVLILLVLPLATAFAQSNDPRVVGQWSPVKQWPFVAIHASLLPNGNIVSWARKDGVTQLETWVGDPETATFTRVMNTYVQPFCAGHTLLPDGRLLVAGGHDKFDLYGAIQTTIFDYRTNTWSRSANMNAGRWYPSTCALANGDVLVASGEIRPNAGGEGSTGRNGLPQVWSKTTGTWRNLEDARDDSIEWYPWLLRGGPAFWAGPRAASAWLDTSGNGRWIEGPDSSIPFRDYGSAVMYEPGKVLIAGGGNPPTSSAETIDLNAKNPQWHQAHSMNLRRRQMNATILADGKVLVTGGTIGRDFNNIDPRLGAYQAEMWDPATNTWTLMAKASELRVYHSVALLLPDGRVLTAGGGLPPWGPNPSNPNYEKGPFHANGQIYSPPYLFKGPRPTIASVPAKVRYGQTFSVSTPDAQAIGAVTWIHPGAVTHSFDQGQRFVSLSFTAAAGSLNVTAPPDGKIAPPGPYMLFIINRASGVPSVAKWVTIE